MASQPIADVDHQNPTVISAEKSSVPQSESTSRDASANADSVARLSEDQNNGDAPVEKVVTGAPLSQVPSQAQKLGKKKVFIVMFALCVCDPIVCRPCTSTDANHAECLQMVLFLAALDMVGCSN